MFGELHLGLCGNEAFSEDFTSIYYQPYLTWICGKYHIYFISYFRFILRIFKILFTSGAYQEQQQDSSTKYPLSGFYFEHIFQALIVLQALITSVMQFKIFHVLMILVNDFF